MPSMKTVKLVVSYIPVIELLWDVREISMEDLRNHGVTKGMNDKSLYYTINKWEGEGYLIKETINTNGLSYILIKITRAFDGLYEELKTMLKSLSFT